MDGPTKILFTFLGLRKTAKPILWDHGEFNKESHFLYQKTRWPFCNWYEKLALQQMWTGYSTTVLSRVAILSNHSSGPRITTNTESSMALNYTLLYKNNSIRTRTSELMGNEEQLKNKLRLKHYRKMYCRRCLNGELGELSYQCVKSGKCTKNLGKDYNCIRTCI